MHTNAFFVIMPHRSTSFIHVYTFIYKKEEVNYLRWLEAIIKALSTYTNTETRRYRNTVVSFPKTTVVIDHVQ